MVAGGREAVVLVYKVRASEWLVQVSIRCDVVGFLSLVKQTWAADPEALSDFAIMS